MSTKLYKFPFGNIWLPNYPKDGDFVYVGEEDKYLYLDGVWILQKKQDTERAPKRGEIVEVRDDEKQEWKEAIYLCTIEGAYYKHQCVKRYWETQFNNGDLFDIRPYSEIRQKKPKEETIYVPDSIKIEGFSNGDGLSINNGKQSLYYHDGIYKVSQAYKVNEVKCKLIPIDVKDLEVGGTYYHTDYDRPDLIGHIDLYCKYLGNRKYVKRNYDSVSVGDASRKHRYKVVPID